MAKPIKRAAGFIPRGRLEALTDGVYAFAMTLLVVNIELPEGFDPKTNQEFLSRLAGLSDTFIAYRENATGEVGWIKADISLYTSFTKDTIKPVKS